jgi:transcriptional regulator with XRE-family HTH domain
MGTDKGNVEDIIMNLGDKLKQLREKSGLSQYQVADKLNISRSRYNSWENNIAKPRYEMLEKISSFYSVDVNYIASEELPSTNINLSQLLKKLRGEKSLREAAKEIGISHTYLDSLENGDKRSGKMLKPTPDTLKLISKAYNFDYYKLMSIAGYLEEVVGHENDLVDWFGGLSQSDAEKLKQIWEVINKE